MISRLSNSLRKLSPIRSCVVNYPSKVLLSSSATMPGSTERLTKLRSLMKDRNVDVYVIPSGDSHSSEYIADCDGRREYISCFTGSAGIAVVAQNAAALATDGRYFNQASQQLDENWTLLKQGMKDVPTWQAWAAEQSKGGKTVGVDPLLVSGTDAKHLASLIEKAGGSELKAVDDNLIDLVWGGDQPSRPSNSVIIQPQEYTGATIKDKLTNLREVLAKRSSPGFFITMLDEVAWLYNLRGTDIPFNPVFFSYAAVTPTTATLYVDASKLDDVCSAQLSEADVKVKPYENFLTEAQDIYKEVSGGKDSDGETGKFIISNAGSWALKRALGGDNHVDSIRSPIADSKAIKTEAELQGMRNCHVRDGAALIEYFAWLEDQLLVKKATLTEAEAADKLFEFRSAKELFKGNSFPTISSSGPNAAIMHYQPEHGACSTIDVNAMYLCDSGAQYHDGTTDTTRTFHFGQPTEKEIEAYTRVLKGLIALDRAVFPKGTNGTLIDCLARQHLWNVGVDFRHGTGHGVGSYLNVHEGPMGIGFRPHYAEVSLAAGQVLSNEPGYYEDGSFGVRIENIIMIKEAETKWKFGEQGFLSFENVTVVPYFRKLIDMSLITQEEKDWLNASNKFVLEKMAGRFDNDPLTKAWLERETQPY